jgi:hypothetical protein
VKTVWSPPPLATEAPESDASQSASAHQLVFPQGVLVSPADAAKTFVDGVYAAGAGDPICCWLAPVATVRVARVPSRAMAVWVYVPSDIPKYAAHPPSLEIRLGGKVVAPRAPLPRGSSAVRITLPPDAVGRPATLQLASDWFVPDAELHNGDTRRLGVYLVAVDGGEPPARAGVPATVLPEGLYEPAGDPGAALRDGVYPSPSTFGCCWLAPRATIRFLKTAGAGRVTLAVRVRADIPKYAHAPPWLRVLAGNRVVWQSAHLAPGENEVAFALPPALRAAAGAAAVGVSSDSFVPDRELHNGDTRSLGLLLEAVRVTP